jgi:hypothetical protein
MTKIDASAISDLKTIGFTPLIYCSDQALFNVRARVPIVETLSQALVILARKLCRVAFALMKNQSEYQPNLRLQGSPAT